PGQDSVAPAPARARRAGAAVPAVPSGACWPGRLLTTKEGLDMQKIKQWLGIATLALTAACAASAARADTLDDILKRGEFRVAVQTSGPLMSFMDKSGKRTGLAVEVAQRMADDLGVKLVLQDYEWKGLIPALLA